ncbi:MAG: hypothetical protein ACD_61C00232G0001 [uncultured bacterium]|nr:MAG: hypothetical protein ACD_61C00232G0001 [uncultured bacterium]
MFFFLNMKEVLHAFSFFFVFIDKFFITKRVGSDLPVLNQPGVSGDLL